MSYSIVIWRQETRLKNVYQKRAKTENVILARQNALKSRANSFSNRDNFNANAKIPRKIHPSDYSVNFLRFIRKRNDLSRYIIRASDRITRK